jgi:predicted porin
LDDGRESAARSIFAAKKTREGTEVLQQGGNNFGSARLEARLADNNNGIFFLSTFGDIPMKKSLIALAVFGTFATTASAEVTLYGTADAAIGFFETETRDGVGAATETEEVTGIVDGDAFSTSPSRFGIKASSDFGNGLKGLAHFEAAIDIANGDVGNPDTEASLVRDAAGNIIGVDAETGTNLFHRRAVVGLSGGFGQVFFGRAQVPIHYALSDTGAFDTSGLDTAQDEFSVPGFGDIGYGAAPGGIRRNGSIYYVSPEFAGMKLDLQYAPNRTESEDGGGITTETTNNAYGASLSYENGPIVAAVAYDRFNEETEVTGAVTEETERTSWLVGGVYDFNVAKVFANYLHHEVDAAAAATQPELRQYEIGVRAPIGNFIALASVGRNEFEAGAAEADGTDYVLGLDYKLAKSTFVYARAGKTFALEADDGSFEQETTAYGLGVRHSF